MMWFKICGLILCWTLSAYGKELTLKKFIALAEKNDPQFKQIFTEKERLKFIKDEALPSRQFLVSLSDEKGYGTGSNTNTSVLTGEISKDIIQSGTAVSLSHSRSVQPGREEEVTKLRVEQALLNNSFGRDVRLKELALDMQQNLGELKVVETYEDYLLSLSDSYLSYKKAYLDVQLANKVHTEAIKMSQNVLKKFTSNIASKTDLDRSKLLVLLKKEDLITKEKELDFIKQSLQKIIGAENELSPPSGLSEKYLKLNISKKGFEADYSKLRKYIIAKEEVEVSNKEAILKSRENGVSLNLIAGYNQDKSQRFNTAVDRSETVIGLKLDIPIGDSKGNAAGEIAFIEKYQNELNLREINSLMTKDLDNIQTELKQIKEKIDINKQKIQFTESILRDEENRYKYGRIDLDKLIETTNSYAAYRLEYQSNIVEFNRMILKWYALTDQLIEKKDSL